MDSFTFISIAIFARSEEVDAQLPVNEESNPTGGGGMCVIAWAIHAVVVIRLQNVSLASNFTDQTLLGHILTYLPQHHHCFIIIAISFFCIRVGYVRGRGHGECALGRWPFDQPTQAGCICSIIGTSSSSPLINVIFGLLFHGPVFRNWARGKLFIATSVLG